MDVSNMRHVSLFHIYTLSYRVTGCVSGRGNPGHFRARFQSNLSGDMPRVTGYVLVHEAADPSPGLPAFRAIAVRKVPFILPRARILRSTSM